MVQTSASPYSFAVFFYQEEESLCVPNLMHCPAYKHLFLMLPVVAIMTMTCLDCLPRNSKAHNNFIMIDLFGDCHNVRVGKFTFLGHWPPSQALKLSLIIITSRLEIQQWTRG